MVKMYQVEYEDVDEAGGRSWIKLPLEMCTTSRHCGCYNKDKLDVCSSCFYNVANYKIAKDIAFSQRLLGRTVRIMVNEVFPKSTTKRSVRKG
jgi:hypothetical protein